MKNTVFVLANSASSSRPRHASANRQHGSFYWLPLSKPVYYPQPGRDSLGGSGFYGLHVVVVYRQRPVRCLLLKKHRAARPQMRPVGMEKQGRATLRATWRSDRAVWMEALVCVRVCLRVWQDTRWPELSCHQELIDWWKSEKKK